MTLAKKINSVNKRIKSTDLIRYFCHKIMFYVQKAHSLLSLSVSPSQTHIWFAHTLT